MRVRMTAMAGVVAMLGMFSPGPAGAAGPVIVALAGAQTTGYATPVMAVQAGGEITFASADIVVHNVESNAIGPDTNPWCGLFVPGDCPLFWSDYVSIGSTAVLGLEAAVPGTIYTFYCAPHKNSMTGRLVVLPASG